MQETAEGYKKIKIKPSPPWLKELFDENGNLNEKAEKVMQEAFEKIGCASNGKTPRKYDWMLAMERLLSQDKDYKNPYHHTMTSGWEQEINDMVAKSRDEVARTYWAIMGLAPGRHQPTHDEMLRKIVEHTDRNLDWNSYYPNIWKIMMNKENKGEISMKDTNKIIKKKEELGIVTLQGAIELEKLSVKQKIKERNEEIALTPEAVAKAEIEKAKHKSALNDIANAKALADRKNSKEMNAVSNEEDKEDQEHNIAVKKSKLEFEKSRWELEKEQRQFEHDLEIQKLKLEYKFKVDMAKAKPTPDQELVRKFLDQALEKQDEPTCEAKLEQMEKMMKDMSHALYNRGRY